MLILDLFCKRS